MADVRGISSQRGQVSPEVREARLKKATQDFEALFLTQMWKQMRQGMGKDGLLSSPMSESYISLFDQEMGVKMAEVGGIGLADMLSQQLQARLERAGKNASAPLSLLRAPAVPPSVTTQKAAQEAFSSQPQPDPSLAAVDALAERIVREKAAVGEEAHNVPHPGEAAALAPQTVSVASPLSSSEGIWLTW